VVRLGVMETIRGSCDEDATGEGVSLIGTSGWYCSIDEYSCRCDPQGTRGSSGVSTRGGSGRGGLGSFGMNGGTNGDGSMMGGIDTLGTTDGNVMSSFGKDGDGWIKG